MFASASRQVARGDRSGPTRPSAPVAASASARGTRLRPSSVLVGEALADPGEPLHAATRTEMEARLGRDFGGVRVHVDASAARSAQALGAAAYTVGREIVFQPGRYAPGTPAGRRLLAHELTHVLQQSRGSGDHASGPVGRTAGPHDAIRLGKPGDRFELEAERAAEGAIAGVPWAARVTAVTPVGRGSVGGLLVQRSNGTPTAPAPAPPAWLGSYAAGAVHVRKDVWSVQLPTLGNSWVGPYDQLSAFITDQGFSGRLQAAHIVGREHLADLNSGWPGDQAPCVAVANNLHQTWTTKTTHLQKRDLGGRHGGRAVPSRADLVGLYDELYDDVPEVREMARNIITAPRRDAGGSLMPRPRPGSRMPPPATSPMDAHEGSPVPKRPPPVPKPASPMDAHEGSPMPKRTSPMPAGGEDAELSPSEFSSRNVRRTALRAGDLLDATIAAIPFVTALYGLHQALQMVGDFEKEMVELESAGHAAHTLGLDALPSPVELRWRYARDPERLQPEDLAWLKEGAEAAVRSASPGTPYKYGQGLRLLSNILSGIETRVDQVNELNLVCAVYIDKLQAVLTVAQTRSAFVAEFLHATSDQMKTWSNVPQIEEQLLSYEQTATRTVHLLGSFESALQIAIDGYRDERARARDEWFQLTQLYNVWKPRYRKAMHQAGRQSSGGRDAYAPAELLESSSR